jgi:hypothetical protein
MKRRGHSPVMARKSLVSKTGFETDCADDEMELHLRVLDSISFFWIRACQPEFQNRVLWR